MDGLASAFDALVGPASSEGLLREGIIVAGDALAPQSASDHLEIRPPKTDDELRALVLSLWGVRIPDVQICPNHCTPWRAFSDAFFARSPVTVWKASRGFGGKTYLLAVLGLTESVVLAADVNVLGGSGEQAARVHEYMHQWWGRVSAPRNMLASDPSKRETRLRTGNYVRALMGSSRSVRGPHPQRLRCDEIDEMDLAVFDAALGQPMGRGNVPAQTVASSTHQYADGTMTEVLKRAAARNWPVHEWCYRETMEPHGWLSAAEIESKKLQVTESMWKSEYDMQEPSPESRAIQPAAVAAMFRRELGNYEGAPRQYIEHETPEDGARYVTGTDWARKQDWTIIITLRVDTKPARLVAFERLGRESWPTMVARLDERMKRYPGAGAHDATGVGDVVAGYLQTHVNPVLMVGRDRADMLTEYIAAVERGDIVSPLIRCMESEHRLASVDDVYGSGHLPDTVAAGALAWHALTGPGANLLAFMRSKIAATEAAKGQAE